MPLSPETLSKLWDSLTTKRLWLYAAIFAGSAYILFVPDHGPVVVSPLRKGYSPWIAAVFVFAGALTFTSLLSSVAAFVWSKVSAHRQRLVITPDEQRTYWLVAQMPGKPPSTQFYIPTKIYNPGPKALYIVKTQLTWPLHPLVHPPMMLTTVLDPLTGAHSKDHPIRAHATRSVRTDISLSGAHGGSGASTVVAVALTDQTGTVHRFRATLRRPDQRA